MVYYEYLDALKLELFAQVASLRASEAGRLVKQAGEKTADLQGRASGKVGASKPAQKVGQAAEETAKFIADLPLLALPTDVIRKTHCIDQHVASVKAAPDNPTRLVQLAEAMRAVREEQTLVRVVRRADPSTLVTSLATQFLIGLAKEE